MNNQKIAELKKQQVYLEEKFVELKSKKTLKKVFIVLATTIVLGGIFYEICIDHSKPVTFLCNVFSIPFWAVGFWKFKYTRNEFHKTKKQIQDTKIAIIDAES